MKFRIVEQRGVFRIRKSAFVGWLLIRDWEGYCGMYGRPSPLDFDTYEKAENHIKKFYGLKGVDAIEKPEWKTV